MVATVTNDQLVKALQVGKEQVQLLAKQEGGNRFEDMTGYGKNWPGTMKDQLKEPAGKDPAEVFKQLTIPGLEGAKGLKINPKMARISGNTIMLPFSTRGNDPFDDEGNDLNTPIPNPDPTQPFDWAHGEHFDEYGRIIQDPTFGIDPGGGPVRLDHMEQSPEEQERNKGLHDWKYHDGPDPDVVRGMMIMADAAGLTKHLKGIGQDQRTGTMKKSGLGPDELIRELLIGVEKFKA